MDDIQATNGLPCPVPYSIILLLGFNEEEYFNRPAEGEENIQEGGAKVEAKKEKEDEEESNRPDGGSLDTPHICEVPCAIIRMGVCLFYGL